MDIETNPGPDINGHVMQVMDWRFSQVINCMQTNTANIYRLIEDKFGNLANDFRSFTAEVRRLQQMSQENREAIQGLQEDRDKILDYLHELERKVEATEKETKQCNIKFIGLEESSHEDASTDVEFVIEVLNEYSTSASWRHSDINRAFRVGIPRQYNRQPRPLIVQFCRWADKMAILTDRVLRDNLRRQGIKVAADLTASQRDTIDFYRREGKVAYFRNGRLQFADHNPSNSRNQYKDSEDRQTWNRDVGGFDDNHWPQLSRRSQGEHSKRNFDRKRSPRKYQNRNEDRKGQYDHRQSEDDSRRRESQPVNQRRQGYERLNTKQILFTRRNNFDSNPEESIYTVHGASSGSHSPEERRSSHHDRSSKEGQQLKRAQCEDSTRRGSVPVVPGNHLYSTAVASRNEASQLNERLDENTDDTDHGERSQRQNDGTTGSPVEDEGQDVLQENDCHQQICGAPDKKDEDIETEVNDTHVNISPSSTVRKDYMREEGKGQIEQFSDQEHAVQTSQATPTGQEENNADDGREQGTRTTENRLDAEQEDILNRQSSSGTRPPPPVRHTTSTGRRDDPAPASQASPAARRLRSRPANSKGRSPVQDSIVHSFRRMQSHDRADMGKSGRGRTPTRRVNSVCK